MGLFESLNDLKLPPDFPIQCDLTDAGPGVKVSNFLVHFRDAEHARMYGSIYRITVHRSRGDSGLKAQIVQLLITLLMVELSHGRMKKGLKGCLKKTLKKCLQKNSNY